MPNPLEKAIAAAVKSNDFQRQLFASMGTSEHPRGAVLSAYRNARRAMATALREQYPTSAAADVMQALQRTVKVEMRELLQKALLGGLAEARLQLGFYKVDVPGTFNYTDLLSQVDRAEGVITGNVVLQASVIDALIRGGSAEMILGDGDRIGVLRPGDVLMAGAFWLSSTLWNSFSYTVNIYAKEKKLQKQAIAAIDNRTTDCCLRVHGQIVDLDKNFKLTGTPRYADEMEWSPFHGWCRTSIALYDGTFDDGITDDMHDAASQVIDERSRGIYNTRRPADAYG